LVHSPSSGSCPTTSTPFLPFSVPPFFLTGHAYLKPLSGTFARKTFDTRTILHSSEPILTIGSDTTCQVYKEGVSLGRTTPMRSEPNHIRHWHHSQPKTLRQWVYGSLFLYSALLTLVRFLRGGFTGENNTNETWAQPHKILTPLSTQNLKAMGLWVLILI